MTVVLRTLAAGLLLVQDVAKAVTLVTIDQGFERDVKGALLKLIQAKNQLSSPQQKLGRGSEPWMLDVAPAQPHREAAPASSAYRLA